MEILQGPGEEIARGRCCGQKETGWLYDCQLQKWSVLADANFPSALRWSPVGDALYFQDTDEVEQSVFRVPIATREMERVTSDTEYK